MPLSQANHQVSPPVIDIPRAYNAAADLLGRHSHHPEKPAYIDASSGKSLSYAALNEQSHRFAQGLLSLGLQPEQRVLLCMHDGLQWPVAFLGCLLAGVVPVAVNLTGDAPGVGDELNASLTVTVIVPVAVGSEFAVPAGATAFGQTKNLWAPAAAGSANRALCAALSVLLQEGIGDTIRISLTPEPGAPREKEVIVAQEILQTMGLRNFTPMVIACPGCGRTTSTVFQELAARIQSYLREQMPTWKVTHPGVEEMNVAVMGCIVNGPGESKHANIGISLPGTGESPAAPVFVDGVKVKTLRGERIAEEFQTIVDEYVRTHYGAQTETA